MPIHGWNATKRTRSYTSLNTIEAGISLPTNPTAATKTGHKPRLQYQRANAKSRLSNEPMPADYRPISDEPYTVPEEPVSDCSRATTGNRQVLGNLPVNSLPSLGKQLHQKSTGCSSVPGNPSILLHVSVTSIRALPSHRSRASISLSSSYARIQQPTVQQRMDLKPHPSQLRLR